MTVGDLARTMPRINVALENRQADYQNSMMEVEGKINQIPISILIDSGASLSHMLFRNKHPYNLGSGVTNVHLKLADNQL